MDTKRLEVALADEFGGDASERRVIARQARDLADSGKSDDDRGHSLSVSEIVRQLSDAPDDSSVIERWNWWMGALDTAYGGYGRFAVRVVSDDGGADVNR
ncbi:MAG: hypothetical protein A07HR60_00623 [uncultured archaeon A07HR60]|jgi:hypothetical protein|nr:MAG: hypothetical protein A07HR60_00623 [uncultured archaeon A07HR60]